MDPLFPTGMGDRRGCSSQGQRLAGSYMVLKVSVKNTELNLTQSPAELGGGGALITVTGPSSSDRNSSRAKKRRTALSQHSHILPFPTPLPLPPPPLCGHCSAGGRGLPLQHVGMATLIQQMEKQKLSVPPRSLAQIQCWGSQCWGSRVSLKTQPLKPPPYKGALCQKRWLSWKHRCEKMLRGLALCKVSPKPRCHPGGAQQGRKSTQAMDSQYCVQVEAG